MAKTINIYLQDDVVNYLKENKEIVVSRLINDLLREHFNKLNPETMTAKELRKLIERRKIEKDYKAKLEALEK